MLAFVFASLLAVVPLLIAAASVTTAFLAILGLTYLINVNFVVQFLVGLIGLGVAIDYSLLLITRWREELAHGSDNEAAIGRAMDTAGRAIVFSGVTVALGLLALIALPIPFIRSIGLGGMLIPLISVAVTLTLVPAVLAGIGPRLEWPRLRHEGKPSRGWTAWARLVVRQRWLATAAGLAILVALGVAALGMHVGDASVNSLSQQGPARDGVVMLEQAGHPGRGARPDRGAGAEQAERGEPWSRPLPACPASGLAVAPPGPAWQPRRHVAGRGAAGRGRRRHQGPGDRRCAPHGAGASRACRAGRRLLGRPGRSDSLALRRFPVCARRPGGDHVRPAGPRVPVAAAAAEGHRAEPAVGRRGLRSAGPGLAGRVRCPGDLGSASHRRDHRAGSRCSCSPSCTACRWTTRYSSWPGCARSSTRPARPTRR